LDLERGGDGSQNGGVFKKVLSELLHINIIKLLVQ
jgi:hypothetical protein